MIYYQNNSVEKQRAWKNGKKEDKACRLMLLSQLTIMKKTSSIFTYIQDEQGEKSETFGAGRGWFDKFKKRSNHHNIKITGEAASADYQATLESTTKLKFRYGQSYMTSMF